MPKRRKRTASPGNRARRPEPASGSNEIKIILVRHGQAGGPPRPREREAPLTALGERQARRVAERLSGERFDHAYCSDLSRALGTARAILRYHRTTPLTVTADIREVSVHHARRGRTPRRKGLAQRLRRERVAVNRFCRRLVSRHRPGQCILIVAHGSVIGMIISVLAGVNPKHSLPLDMRNGSVSVVTLRKGGHDIWNRPARIDLCNCLRHLLPGQVT